MTTHTTPFAVGLGVLFLGFAISRRARSSKQKQSSSPSIGCDIGGSFLKIALILNSAIFFDELILPIPPGRTTPAEIIDSLISSAQELLLKHKMHTKDLVGLGICCPGRVREDCVDSVANLRGWKNVKLKEMVEARMKDWIGKVKCANDANAALIGEMTNGAARGKKNVVMITIGTGVGGSVAVDGKVLTGATGMFGEIGHEIIVVNGRMSKSTGVRGIAEEYCSASALRTTWTELVGGDPPAASEIMRLAHEGLDDNAMHVTRHFFDHVGVLIVNACRAYDPECVILGGGLVSSQWFVDQCAESALELQWSIAPPTYVVHRAEHGNWAGAMGVAKLAVDFANGEAPMC